MSAIRLCIALTSLFIAGGCAPQLGYQVQIANTGSREISDVRVTYGRFVDRLPQLAPGIDSTYLDVQEPLPKEAIVEWRDADGEAHRQVVKVTPRSEFRGVLVFEIDGENRVKVLTESPPRY